MSETGFSLGPDKKPNQKLIHFVGRIVSIDLANTEATVTFIQKKRINKSDSTLFIWPDVDDQSCVSDEDVINVKEWSHKIRKESNQLDRQIRESTGAYCKQKMVNLLASYRRKKMKMKTSMGTRKGRDELYEIVDKNIRSASNYLRRYRRKVSAASSPRTICIWPLASGYMTTMDYDREPSNGEEDKVKRSLKEAAKKGDKGVCTILAKEVIRARKAVNKIHTSKAHLNSIMLQMKNQSATLRVAGALQKSTEVMQAMQNLVRVPEVAAAMRELSKEMMRAGIIEEMLEETMDTMEDPEEMEEEAGEEVDK
ncbi:unnamed protein product, partial [Timema podura]|nr:unnamed protein product [Timema podura]